MAFSEFPLGDSSFTALADTPRRWIEDQWDRASSAVRARGARWLANVETEAVPGKDLPLLAALMGGVALVMTLVALGAFGLEGAEAFDTRLELQHAEWAEQQAQLQEVTAVEVASP